MKKISLLFALLLALGLHAQTPSVPLSCGITPEDQANLWTRLEKNQLAIANSGAGDRNAIQYVPIHFHFVGNNDGSGKTVESRILEQLCDLNFYFEPLEIRFYLSPHPQHGLFNKSINNTSINTEQTNTDEFSMALARHPNAVNIFVTEIAESGNNGPGLTLAYYNTVRDWIVIRKDRANGNNLSGTLPHEVGHFFSLLHTFNGWEPNPFDSADPGWPTAPTVSPLGIATERQNGSNCNTSGDGICDTPPDYNFGLGFGSCSQYDLGAKDPLGVTVDPMETNMMGYFENCGNNYVFSPVQQQVILADRNQPDRNYLDNSYSPPATSITTPADLLVNPANNATTPTYDEILFEWQAVTGATYYLLECDITQSFNPVSPFYQSFLTTSTSQLVTSLSPSRTYRWRVRPFNEYYTCATPQVRTIITNAISDVQHLDLVDAWQISPNPLSAGQSLTLALTARQSFEANLYISSIEGKELYRRENLPFSAGENYQKLELPGLSKGMYVVYIESANGRETRKLIVGE